MTTDKFAGYTTECLYYCKQAAEGGAYVQVFEAAPQDVRGVPAKKAAPDYFL